MGDWAVVDAVGSAEAIGYDSSTNSWTTSITSHSTNANVKGSWVQLTASTSFFSKLMVIQVGYVANPCRHLLDIGIGGAGAEVVLIPDLLLEASVEGHVVNHVIIPVSIPAGSIISARSQSSPANKSVGISLQFFSYGFLTFDISGKVNTYGANTGTSGGTSIDPGASANTKGAWTELSAAIAPTKMIFASLGDQLNAIRTWAAWRLDIGVGAAGSEQVVIPDIHLVSGGTVDEILPKFTVVYPFNVPAGSRVSVRSQCEITDATDRKFDIVLYGIS